MIWDTGDAKESVCGSWGGKGTASRTLRWYIGVFTMGECFALKAVPGTQSGDGRRSGGAVAWGSGGDGCGKVDRQRRQMLRLKASKLPAANGHRRTGASEVCRRRRTGAWTAVQTLHPGRARPEHLVVRPSVGRCTPKRAAKRM